MKLSIIIPVFNEEKSVLDVIKRVKEVTIPGVTKEIIIVNDGSTDGTEEKLQNIDIKHITIINHKKNQGKGAAVITGIKHATGKYIVIQDADLEYDPQFITKLIEPILAGNAKVVYGTRLNRLPNFKKEEGEPLFLLHYAGNRFLSLLTSLIYGQWITDMETCYKVFPKSAVSSMQLTSRGFEFEPEITAKLLKKGYKIMEIPITTKPRGYEEGKKLNALKEGPKALWILLKYRFM
jgi:dolichol-phosphate mannosyltransferase